MRRTSFGLQGPTYAAVAFIVPDDLALYLFGVTLNLILPEHNQVYGRMGQSVYASHVVLKKLLPFFVVLVSAYKTSVPLLC